jgi:glycosyltransferase involved in cell wall biosynthesis
MNIGIVIPSNLKHRVRGTGYYLENLKKAFLKYYPNNYSFIKAEDISSNLDLVHYPFFEPFFLTLPIFKKNKTIVTVHDLTPLVFSKFFPKGLRGLLKWQLQKIALKNSDAIITDSNSSKKDILKFVGVSDAKVKVVYLAPGEEFKKLKDLKSTQDLKNKYNLPEKFVLYVGDVTWNKNLPRLVKAIIKLDIPFVMVGKALIEDNFDKDNPWNQDLVEVQKLVENNKKIKRLGFVSTSDLVGLYNLAAVFAMPSVYEGFGLPVLEAMSCGTPVVTTKKGSLHETTEGNAFYVDPYDIDNIAEGIKMIFMDDKMQKDFSQKGLNQAKKFTWQKTARETLDVYKNVLE